MRHSASETLTRPSRRGERENDKERFEKRFDRRDSAQERNSKRNLLAMASNLVAKGKDPSWKRVDKVTKWGSAIDSKGAEKGLAQ